MNFEVTSISQHDKEKGTKIYFKPGKRDRVWRRAGETSKESQHVKPKYYYTCYNSLLFQWQGSWSEGDFITLQVIASYIKLGWPQFLGSRSVWLTVKLTALHHGVIRLACWLCIKQEQTELAALLRLPAGTRTPIRWWWRHAGELQRSGQERQPVLVMGVCVCVCVLHHNIWLQSQFFVASHPSFTLYWDLWPLKRTLWLKSSLCFLTGIHGEFFVDILYWQFYPFNLQWSRDQIQKQITLASYNKKKI